MTASRRIKELGRDRGFDLVRIARATEMHVERARYLAWVAAGRQAEMRWIDEKHAIRSASPDCVLPGAAAVISLGMSYWSGTRPPAGPHTGLIARYAWGADYHRVLGERLSDLAGVLRQEFGGEHRWYVDTGPVMDKAHAARAGVGWYGKNSNILTERFGSFVVLGEILTTLAIEPDVPLGRDCGPCRLCAVACPTGAIGPEYSVDSRKCISYLTIEHRGAIPLDLRSAMGAWVFGCDICQDVCPPTMEPYLADKGERRAWTAEIRRYVRGANAPVRRQVQPQHGESATPVPGDHPLFREGRRPDVDLLWLLRLHHEEYLHAFRGTAIRRAKVWMLRRNAAVALGNIGNEDCVPALTESMRADENPVVRGHSAWALGRIGRRCRTVDIDDILVAALVNEEDVPVRDEIALAREALRS